MTPHTCCVTFPYIQLLGATYDPKHMSTLSIEIWISVIWHEPFSQWIRSHTIVQNWRCLINWRSHAIVWNHVKSCFVTSFSCYTIFSYGSPSQISNDYSTMLLSIWWYAPDMENDVLWAKKVNVDNTNFKKQMKDQGKSTLMD